MVVVLAAVLLPAGDVLRDDQISDRSAAWSCGRLGKTGTKSHGRSAALNRTDHE